MTHTVVKLVTAAVVVGVVFGGALAWTVALTIEHAIKVVRGIL